MIHSTHQRLHYSFHFQLKKNGTHTVYRDISLNNQRINVQIITTQNLDHTHLLLRQFRKKTTLDSGCLATFLTMSPIHSLHEI